MADLKNPVKAIRAKCIDCSGNQINEVRLCTVKGCALYPFRMGKNPYRTKVTRELTDEQRAANAERLRKAREAKKLAQGE